MRKTERAPDLKVELRLFSNDEGGLPQSLPQGCRLPNDFGLKGEMNDGMYFFEGDQPSPGETVLAELWLLVPERDMQNSSVDRKKELYGSRCRC